MKRKLIYLIKNLNGKINKFGRIDILFYICNRRVKAAN